jgi:hypothetical protein
MPLPPAPPTPVTTPPRTTSPSPTPPVRPKVGKNVLVVSLILCLGVLSVLFLGGYAVAKSGLYHLPFFTPHFYSGPQPVRQINAAPMDQAAFKNLVAERFIAERVSKPKPPYVLKLSESELTGVFEGTLATGLRGSEWRVRHAQMAATHEGLEMFGNFVGKGVQVDLLIRFKTTVDAVGVKFVPTYIQIGGYPIPVAWALKAGGYLFQRDLGSWNLNLGEYKMQKMEFYDGQIEVTVAP